MGLSCKSTCSRSDGACWSLTEAECQTRLENALLGFGHPFPFLPDWLRNVKKALSENVFLTAVLVIVARAQFQHWGYIDFGRIAWCNAIQFSKVCLDSNFRAWTVAYMGYVLHCSWRVRLISVETDGSRSFLIVCCGPPSVRRSPPPPTAESPLSIRWKS